MRFAALIPLSMLLAGSLCAQPTVAPGTDHYLAFFRDVAQLKRLSDHPEIKPVSANGSSVELVLPRIQDVIGLSDRETDLLTSAATACIARNIPRHEPVVLEARLQEAEIGRVSEPVASQVREFEQKIREMVLVYVRQLRSDYGEERFRILDDFVRSSRWLTSLVPKRAPSQPR